MVTELPWGDGSGDKIYLTYEASEGDQTVTVSSDAYIGDSFRTKDITFTVSVGSTTIARVLTVRQSADSVLTIITRNGVAAMSNETVVGYKQ